MKYLLLIALLFLIGCASTPTVKPIMIEWLFVNGKWIHVTPIECSEVIDIRGELL